MARIAGTCDDFHYRGAFNPREDIAIWSVDVSHLGDHAFCLHGQVPVHGAETDLRLIEARIHEAVTASIHGGLERSDHDELRAWPALALACADDKVD